MNDLRDVKTKCTSINKSTEAIQDTIEKVEKSIEEDLKEIKELMNT